MCIYKYICSGGYSLSDLQNATLTPMHLRKAKLMFFWVSKMSVCSVCLLVRLFIIYLHISKMYTSTLSIHWYIYVISLILYLHIYIFVFLSIYFSIHLSIYLSIYLFIYQGSVPELRHPEDVLPGHQVQQEQHGPASQVVQQL